MRRLTFKAAVWALVLSLTLGSPSLVLGADRERGTREALRGPDSERASARTSSENGDKEWDGPMLLNYELYQLGASEVVFGLSGKDLPEPEVNCESTRVSFLIRDTHVDRAEMTNHALVTPMISDMQINQISDDVEIVMETKAPLSVRSKRGSAPSNEFSYRMIAGVEEERIRREPVETRPKLEAPKPVGPFADKTKITLDLRDTELRDVFRMLGAHLKKNVIIDPSLPPALVTMTLKNVPLSEAFDYLMRTYDISYHMVGKDTIVVGTQDGLSRLSGNEETRTFNIAYGDPTVLQGLLVNLTKLPADRVLVDPRLRALYVTSTPQKLMEVNNILQKMDKPGKQVMIYAKIFEFSDSVTDEVETALNAVYNHWWLGYSGKGGMRGGYADDNRLGRNLKTDNHTILPLQTDLRTPMHGIWREFDGAFRALENKGKGKTLANPSVIAIDGMEAKVELTEDYPYISERDDAGNPTWSTQTIGPQMTMTPKVGRDGVINLTLDLETGQVLEMITGSTGEQMPRTSKRHVTTNVRVRDGEPFVIGGLFSDNKTKTRIRIPILGQLPLLGELFTYRYDEHRKTQVVMLVVPYVLDTPDAAIEQEPMLPRKAAR